MEDQDAALVRWAARLAPLCVLHEALIDAFLGVDVLCPLDVTSAELIRVATVDNQELLHHM